MSLVTTNAGTFDLYGVGICAMSVCAPDTASRRMVEHAANQAHFRGSDGRWQISADQTFANGSPMPHPCERHPDRTHWLLHC